MFQDHWDEVLWLEDQKTHTKCPSCDGEGKLRVPCGHGTEIKECTVCQGTGEVVKRRS